MPVADCKDCQAAQVKGVFSVWSWRISWLTRQVFPIPGNPTIEIAMGTPPSPPLVRGGAGAGDSLVRGGAVIRVFKVSISLVRCTQFLTGGKFSGRGKVRSFWPSWGISTIAAAKSNSVCLISLRSIISSQLLIPTALQISINVSRRIRFGAQNLLKVAF